MRWQAGNVIIETDPAGNRKPTKSESLDRIDGIVTAIMACGRAERERGGEGVSGDRRGLGVVLRSLSQHRFKGILFHRSVLRQCRRLRAKLLPTIDWLVQKRTRTKPLIVTIQRVAAVCSRKSANALKLMIGGVIALSALHTPAAAQDLYVTGLTERSLEVLDRDTIKWRSGQPEATFHLIHRTPIAVEAGAHYEWQQRTVFNLRFNCTDRTRRILSTTSISFSDEVIFELEELDLWIPAVSEGDLTTISLVCENVVPTPALRSDNIYRLMAAFYEALSLGHLEQGPSGWALGTD